MADPTAPQDQLVHCSPDRTLVRTREPGGGEVELVKIFARGSLEDAARECQMGQRLAHLPVVRYRGSGHDPVTGRPCVRMDLHPGRDLSALLAERGALPPARACRLFASLAGTLAAMHGLRTEELPHGVVHGDVRPANLLCDGDQIRLLDLEHAHPSRGPGDAAADVLGLGQALHLALCGDPRGRLQGHDPALGELVDACRAPLVARRPAAAVVAAALRDIGARLERDPAEALLAEIQRGDLAEAARHGAALPASPRREALLALARRRLAQQQRWPLQALPEVTATPNGVERALQVAAVILRRFPCHGPALQLRQTARTSAATILTTLPERVAELRRQGAFGEAHALIGSATGMLTSALAAPGPLLLPDRGNPRMPSSLQRQPGLVLQRLHDEIRTANAEHDELLAAMTAAEAGLDLAAAERALEAIAGAYGGTAAVVTRCRDRLHRLAFYVERIGRAGPGLERLREMFLAGAAPPLDAVASFVRECGGRRLSGGTAADQPGGMGLRGLGLALHDLATEYPALADRLEPCRRQLDEALLRTTDGAWDLLAEAQDKLAAEPVPVRPLQTALHRLDALRMLESLVDRPERPRSQLLDRIETLRMQLDQARSTRDRLARGAEQALARGHWTTGLFDMERAIDHLTEEAADGEGETPEARRLRQRLDEARRRKQEIEQAVRRNQELARIYAELADDPHSGADQRLRALRERRDLLQFLLPLVQQERGELYGNDLRDVETMLAQELAARAETDLDATDDPAVRLRIARETLEALAGPGVASAEPAGRQLRLAEHWRKVAAAAERELERRQQEELARRGRARRRRVLAIAGAAVLVVGAGLFANAAFAGGDEARGAALVAQRLGRYRDVTAITADRVAAVVELTEASRVLPAALLAAGEQLAAAVRRALDHDRTTDPSAPLDDLHRALGDYAAQLRALDPAEAGPSLRAFGSRCWWTGLCLLAAGRDAATQLRLVLQAEHVAPTVAADGLLLPADFQAALRG